VGLISTLDGMTRFEGSTRETASEHGGSFPAYRGFIVRAVVAQKDDWKIMRNTSFVLNGVC
jgi:hypothetical protein